MAQEFVDRFDRSQYPECVQWVIKELSPSHRWPELDLKISLFSRIKHIGIPFDDSLKFWERMRYLIRPLPRGNRKKTDTSPKLQYPIAPWDYNVCDLCWRSVPVNTKRARRGQTLCFVHDLNPNDSVYRKHKRLPEEVLKVAWDLEEQLQADYYNSAKGPGFRERFSHLNRIHLVNPQSPLKNLVEYITSHFRGYDRTTSNKDDWEIVMEIFHGPFPKGLDTFYREAMEAYIHERVFYESLVDVSQLALAEVWLAALKLDRRRKSDGA